MIREKDASFFRTQNAVTDKTEEEVDFMSESSTYSLTFFLRTPMRMCTCVYLPALLIFSSSSSAAPKMGIPVPRSHTPIARLLCSREARAAVCSESEK